MHRSHLFSTPFLLFIVGCTEPEQRPGDYLGEGAGTGGRHADDEDDDTPPVHGGAGGASDGGATSLTGGSGGQDVTEIPCGETTCTVGTCSMESEGPLCACPAGFGPAEQGCPDLNECEDAGLCGSGACRNTAGGYHCECPPGFSWTGEECVDVNECALGLCTEDAGCDNQSGTFECECPDGAFGNGHFCKKTSDCAHAPCGDGECIETATGYTCDCPLGQAGHASCDSTCATLNLDPELELVVRELVGLPAEAGPLLPVHLMGLTSLDASGREVKTLDGLQCWPHLEHLDLRGTALGTESATYPQPLAAISALSKLETLNLSCTALQDLTGIEAHPSLRELRFNQGSVECTGGLSDVSALAQLSKLEVLSLPGHHLGAFPPIENLTRLRELNLEANDISLLGSFDRLVLLEELVLGQNALSSLAALSPLSALKHLDLGNNEVTSLDGVRDKANLITLRAPHNQIAALGNLSGLTSLVTLDLSLNGLSDLTPLLGHPSLRTLSLVGNEIASLAPLGQSGFVGTLNITHNPLPCVTEREHFMTLLSQGTQIIGVCKED